MTRSSTSGYWFSYILEREWEGLNGMLITAGCGAAAAGAGVGRGGVEGVEDAILCSCIGMMMGGGWKRALRETKKKTRRRETEMRNGQKVK